MKTLNERSAAREAAAADAAVLKFVAIPTSPSHVPNLMRAEVPGGWLIVKKQGGGEPTFLPDPEHKWLQPPAPSMRATPEVKKKRAKKKASKKTRA